MTPYPVEWTTTAEDQLADIWLHAPDPAKVTSAQAAIDQLLGQNPLGHGEAVQEGLRKLTIAPLTVYYEIHAAPASVEVSAVAFTP